MSDLAFIGPNGRESGTRPLLRTLLGDVLRRNRLDQGRTLADVARTARVSMPYLSEVERGRKEASSEVVAAVCDALRIELSDVLAEVGRDLAKDRADRAIVMQLAAIRQHRIAPQHRTAPRHSIEPQRRMEPQARRSGDIVLLAA